MHADLLFYGSKVIWEAYLSSDIYIVRHPSFDVVEVICCSTGNTFFTEPARIYLKYFTLIKCIEQNFKFNTDTQQIEQAVVISKFIFEHLEVINYVPRNKHFNIIVKVDGVEQCDLDLEISKPDGLEPYEIIKTTSSLKGKFLSQDEDQHCLFERMQSLLTDSLTEESVPNVNVISASSTAECVSGGAGIAETELSNYTNTGNSNQRHTRSLTFTPFAPHEEVVATPCDASPTITLGSSNSPRLSARPKSYVASPRGSNNTNNNTLRNGVPVPRIHRHATVHSTIHVTEQITPVQSFRVTHTERCYATHITTVPTNPPNYVLTAHSAVEPYVQVGSKAKRCAKKEKEKEPISARFAKTVRVFGTFLYHRFGGTKHAKIAIAE